MLIQKFVAQLAGVAEADHRGIETESSQKFFPLNIAVYQLMGIYIQRQFYPVAGELVQQLQTFSDRHDPGTGQSYTYKQIYIVKIPISGTGA